MIVNDVDSHCGVNVWLLCLELSPWLLAALIWTSVRYCLRATGLTSDSLTGWLLIEPGFFPYIITLTADYRNIQIIGHTFLCRSTGLETYIPKHNHYHIWPQEGTVYTWYNAVCLPLSLCLSVSHPLVPNRPPVPLSVSCGQWLLLLTALCISGQLGEVVLWRLAVRCHFLWRS